MAHLLLSEIELFCFTAQHQGFTAAARTAGVTTAAVSRSVARLEARLGVRLLTRTTRRVRLTDEGRRYFEQCRQALAQLTEAEREVTGQQARPAGRVKISLPTGYAHHRVLPALPEFTRRYPEIELELDISNRNVDFTDEGFDLAIRGRNPPDSGLVARTLENAPLVIVAAPKYLRAHGRPKKPEDLGSHECIQFLLPRTGAAVPWLLSEGGAVREVATAGRLACAQDILGPATLAKAGGGLAQTYRYFVERELQEGSLVEVMAAYAGASRPFSLLYPANRHLPQRLRVLIDFLVARFARPRVNA